MTNLTKGLVCVGYFVIALGTAVSYQAIWPDSYREEAMAVGLLWPLELWALATQDKP